MSFRLIPHETLIAKTLDRHLRACATKNVRSLRRCFTPTGLFIGTDDSEQWDIKELGRRLAGTKKGWTMKCKERSIQTLGLTASSTFTTFFEVLRHEKYGPMRGSGVVVRDPIDGWKISHYVLSVTVSNRMFDTTNVLDLLLADIVDE